LTPKTDSCVDCPGSAMHGSLTSCSFHYPFRIKPYDLQGCTASNDSNALAAVELETYEKSWSQKPVRTLIDSSRKGSSLAIYIVLRVDIDFGQLDTSIWRAPYRTLH
jgi:hypothetical protein